MCSSSETALWLRLHIHRDGVSTQEGGVCASRYAIECSPFFSFADEVKRLRVSTAILKNSVDSCVDALSDLNHYDGTPLFSLMLETDNEKHIRGTMVVI